MKHFLKDKRGVSTIISMVFFIMILLVGVNFLVWQKSQYTDYQETSVEVNALDQERLSEDLDFKYPGITEIAGSGPYSFNITVNNNGPIGTDIVRIYLGDKDTSTLTILDLKTPSSPYGFLNGFVEPSEPAHKIKVYSPVKPDTSHEYTLRIVTERGRIFATAYPMPIAGKFFEGYFQFSHNSMRFKLVGPGGYDWRPCYASYNDTTSGQLYLRALFGNSGTSAVTLSTDSALLSQINNATANDKVYFIGGKLIDPATMGWPGDLTIGPGETQYLYFQIDSWNIPKNENSIYTGSCGLVGTKDNSEFWSGALLMDAIKITP